MRPDVTMPAGGRKEYQKRASEPPPTGYGDRSAENMYYVKSESFV